MVVVTKPLLRMCAAELMSQNLMMIPQEMSLQGAAKLLSRAHISGAPVVNADGKCVGVLSATDYMQWAEKGGTLKPRSSDVRCSSWQMFESEDTGECRVMDVMNHDPVLVPPSARIGELSRMMMDAHIHRVIVVNGDDRPIGIVSCTDVLAALARADMLEDDSKDRPETCDLISSEHISYPEGGQP
jgi:predicted transcriptional regulator